MVDFSLTEADQRLMALAHRENEIGRRYARERDRNSENEPSRIRGVHPDVAGLESPHDALQREKDLTSGEVIAEALMDMVSATDTNLRDSGEGAFGSWMLNDYGTEAQKAKYGHLKLAIAITEPGAGSDPGAMSTHARYDPATDEYVLNGEKVFISFFGKFDGAVTLMKGEPDGTGRIPFLTVVVTKDLPGVTPIAQFRKLGIRSHELSGFHLQDVRVPASARLDADFGKTMSKFNHNRPLVAAHALAGARSMLDFTHARLAEAGVKVDYAKGRAARGADEDRLIRMEALWEAAWGTVMRAKWLEHQMGSESHGYRVEASVAKALGGKVVRQITQGCLEILGPEALSEEYLAEKWFRDVRIADIYEGAGEIQRILIARALFGYKNELTEPAMERPLEGIVVVDFTAMVAGACCTRLLADCGAEVIKVESSDGGDLMRHVPPYQDRVGLIYALYNAGKKSVVFDLKTPAGLALVRRLIEQADIVVENFRPGVMARLGLDYPAVAKINPQVVYCSISGFGQSGPLSDRAAYAPVAHAFSGVDMMLSRQIDPDAPPLDNRLMIADIQAGHHAFAAIQTALLHRLRHGAGSHVDVTMAEGMMGLVGMQFQQTQGGLDYRTAGFPWFRTLDGYVNIPLVSPNTFRCACKVIGRDDWAADPDYASFAGMAVHREEIRAAMSAWTAARTSEDCDATMNAAGAPCAIYYTPDELLGHPHVVARGSFATIETGSGSFKVLNPPFKISGTACEAVPFVSDLGADTRQVLAERLGCDDAAFDRLTAENAFGPERVAATADTAS